MALAIDLFCGLGGWTDGLLAEGWNVVGFDIERHAYGGDKYPAQLVLQDVLTIHGSQFRKADLIVASPPCQAYSYMAMPWSRAKAKAADIRADSTGEKLRSLNALFQACFRIQREASEAAGHHIPMIVENVRGAQPWVGPAPWNYGSFYLWGDIPALMPHRITGGQKFNPDGTAHGSGSWFAIADSKNRGARSGEKVPGFNFHAHEKGLKGVSFQSAAVAHTRHLTEPIACIGRDDGTKQGGNWWHDPLSITRRHSSKSNARKAASAQIAKIPTELARHIARVFKP